MGTATTKGIMFGLDVVEASKSIARGVMYGSYTLANESYEADESFDLQTALGEIIIDTDIRTDRVAATSVFGLTTFLMGMLWSYSKMAVGERAKFVADISSRVLPLFTAVSSGQGGIYGSRGLNVVKTAAIQLARAEQFTPAEIGIALTTMRQALTDVRMNARVLEDTLNTLEYVNTLGGEGAYLTANARMVGAESSILTADDVSRLRRIAESNSFFRRRGDIVSSRVVGANALNARLFVNPDLAMAADMFLPSNAANDLFSIKNELANSRANLKTLLNSQDEMVQLTRNMDDLIAPYLRPNAPPMPKAVGEALADSGSVLFNYTVSFADDIDALKLVEKELNKKVATATAATDSLLVKAGARIAQFATYVGVKAGTGGLISGQKASSIALNVAEGVKVGGRVVGKVLFWDTVLWSITGAYDLLFVDEDEEYDSWFNNYLTENWGFSVVGLLVDGIVDFLVPEDAQQAFLEALQALIASALTFDSFEELVKAVLDFYVEQINVQVIPFDIWAPQVIDGDQLVLDKLNPIRGMVEADPTLLLWAAIYAITAKLVVKSWILPAWYYFTRQSQGVVG